MKTIKVVGTNIEILVTNAEEMHTVFYRFNGWNALQIDNETYPKENRVFFTIRYFENKYFREE